MASETTGGGAAKTRDFRDYVYHKIYVDITKDQIMANAVRVVNKEDAENMYREDFKDGRYGGGGQLISVAALRGPCWKTVEAQIKEHEGDDICADALFAGADVVVVDVQHRHHVLNLEEVLMAPGHRHPVNFYTTVDGNALDVLEALFIGNELNRQAGKMRPMSTMDHFFSWCSHVKVFLERDEPTDGTTERALRRIRSGSLKEGAAGVSAILNLSPDQKTQTHAYANVVFMCYQQYGIYDVLLDSVEDGTVSLNKRTLSAQ